MAGSSGRTHGRSRLRDGDALRRKDRGGGRDRGRTAERGDRECHGRPGPRVASVGSQAPRPSRDAVDRTLPEKKSRRDSGGPVKGGGDDADAEPPRTVFAEARDAARGRRARRRRGAAGRSAPSLPPSFPPSLLPYRRTTTTTPRALSVGAPPRPTASLKTSTNRRTSARGAGDSYRFSGSASVRDAEPWRTRR